MFLHGSCSEAGRKNALLFFFNNVDEFYLISGINPCLFNQSCVIVPIEQIFYYLYNFIFYFQIYRWDLFFLSHKSEIPAFSIIFNVTIEMIYQQKRLTK